MAGTFRESRVTTSWCFFRLPNSTGGTSARRSSATKAPATLRNDRGPVRPLPAPADGIASTSANTYHAISKRSGRTRRKHAIGGAEQRREPDVDEVDVRQGQDQIGVEHDPLAQQVVDQIEERRVVVQD